MLSLVLVLQRNLTGRIIMFILFVGIIRTISNRQEVQCECGSGNVRFAC